MPARSDFEEAFARLGEYLQDTRTPVRVVLVGGAALNLLGVVSRTTMDADIIAVERAGKLAAPDTLPEAFFDGVREVGRSLNMGPDWLNTGPALQLRFGLPRGFHKRLQWRSFGALDVGIASRKDLICLKLFASADHWPARGVHYEDLRALAPTTTELAWARAWVIGQDASPDFHALVDDLVARAGEDAAK